MLKELIEKENWQFVEYFRNDDASEVAAQSCDAFYNELMKKIAVRIQASNRIARFWRKIKGKKSFKKKSEAKSTNYLLNKVNSFIFVIK